MRPTTNTCSIISLAAWPHERETATGALNRGIDRDLEKRSRIRLERVFGGARYPDTR